MKSHERSFELKDLASLLGQPLMLVGVFALLMKLGAALHILPAPKPTLDMDRTILIHQAEASRLPHIAETVLLGDSSCLMDVSADILNRLFPDAHGVLNLGTLSYLDLDAFASLLQHYLAANPGRLHTVVLLMHPEALRGVSFSADHAAALRDYFAGADHCEPAGVYGRLSCLLGCEIFKGRVLSRLRPTPLPGEYGRYYGFTADLWRHLDEHHGSAVDPREFAPQAGQGNAEFRLAKKLEAASRAFKVAVPPEVKLFVGLTPVPESFAPPNYRQTYDEMLREWSQWLNADAALTNLPPTLHDGMFASTTHLNEAGARAYTESLARALGEIF